MILSIFEISDKSNDISFIFRVGLVQMIQNFDFCFWNFVWFRIVLDHFNSNVHFVLMIETIEDHTKCSLRNELNDLISIVDLVSHRIDWESIFIHRVWSWKNTSSLASVFRIVGFKLRNKRDVSKEIDYRNLFDLCSLDVCEKLVVLFEDIFWSHGKNHVGIDTNLILIWFLVQSFRSSWFSMLLFSFFAVSYDCLGFLE